MAVLKFSVTVAEFFGSSEQVRKLEIHNSEDWELNDME